MAVSLTLVAACFETIIDSTCSGTDASSEWVASGYLTGLALVQYSLGGVSAYAQVNQLPLGSLLFCKMSDGSVCPGAVGPPAGAVYSVEPSVMTFGIASPYQPPFDISQLSSAYIQDSFVAGFLLVLGGFLIGKPLSVLLAMIRS
jgi:hypothetical protein